MSRTVEFDPLSSRSTIVARQRASWPKLRIRAHRSYAGAKGANRLRATLVGVSVT
jgi:hypothetical protein